MAFSDDVTHTSLDYDAAFSTEPDSVIRAMFYGLGADGTVGANKNSIKIIGENTNNYAQGYFVYDSKKSGAMTVSHLRFGPQPIRSSYLVSKANFIACHQWIFLERYDMLSALVEGGTFLVNSPFSKDELWDHLPREVQSQLIAKKAKLYTIDAYTGCTRYRHGLAHERDHAGVLLRYLQGSPAEMKQSKPFASPSGTHTDARAKKSYERTWRRWTRPWRTCSK